MEHGLSEKEQTALKKFKSALNKAIGKELLEIKLFGSKARGEARKDSDIDVLIIISSDDWKISDVVYGIATDILLDDEVCISPKVMSKNDYDTLSSSKTPFMKNVARDAVTV